MIFEIFPALFAKHISKIILNYILYIFKYIVLLSVLKYVNRYKLSKPENANFFFLICHQVSSSVLLLLFEKFKFLVSIAIFRVIIKYVKLIKGKSRSRQILHTYSIF